MATKLKNMHLTSVDLVRAGANQEADICLFKSAEPPEATESPTEHEKGIFKRFIDWLHKNATEDESEPQNHIEKADEQPDLEFIYKSALAESLQSIMADETLTEVEKKSMTEESLRQYNDKIDELERDEEDYDGGDDIDEKAIEEVDDFDKDVRDDIREEEDRIDEIEDEIEDRAEDKIEEKIIRRVLVEEPKRYDEIEEIDVHKYNHNHGADGKFSSNPGAGGGSTTSRAGGTTKAAVQDAIKGAKSPKKVKQALDKAGIEYEDHSEEFGYMNLRCPRNDGGYVRVYKPRHKNQDVIVRDYNPVDLTPSGVPTFDPSWQQAVGLWDGKAKKSAAYDDLEATGAKSLAKKERKAVDKIVNHYDEGKDRYPAEDSWDTSYNPNSRLNKSANIDHIEEVEKYNHNHDAVGRFSDAAGAKTHDAWWHAHQGKNGGGGSGAVNTEGTMSPKELASKESRRDELWDKEDHGKITAKEKKELKDLQSQISEHYDKKREASGSGKVKTKNGVSYREDIDPSWSEYDRVTGQAQLMNFGRIYLDEYKVPIDDEYRWEDADAAYNK